MTANGNYRTVSVADLGIGTVVFAYGAYERNQNRGHWFILTNADPNGGYMNQIDIMPNGVLTCWFGSNVLPYKGWVSVIYTKA